MNADTSSRGARQHVSVTCCMSPACWVLSSAAGVGVVLVGDALLAAAAAAAAGSSKGVAVAEDASASDGAEAGAAEGEDNNAELGLLPPRTRFKSEICQRLRLNV